MDSKKKNPETAKGSMIMAVLFMVFISLVGLTLLTHTITQTRIIRARMQKIDETDRIRQELIRYLHGFREKILSGYIHDYTRPETDFFTEEIFPGLESERVKIKNRFHYLTEEKSFYRQIRITDRLDARAEGGTQVLNALAVIDLVAGNIPLNLIPLFIRSGMNTTPDPARSEPHIHLIGTAACVPDDLPVDFDVSAFLIDALKISGDIPNWAAVRERFGFEVSDDPIEPGIYFLVEDNILESIFIQGDIQKLIFSVNDGIQVIQIHFRDTCRELHYRPGEGYFQSWNEEIPENTLFRERIIVNGNLWSLEQENGRAFQENAAIKLLVSGQTVIRTSLETENLDLEKLKLTHLTLMAGLHSLYNPEDNPPRIGIENDDKIHIQATIMVQGDFANHCPELKLRGSLFAETVQNNGLMDILFLRSAWDSGSFFHTGNTTLVTGFFIDCIEEVHLALCFQSYHQNPRIHRG